MDNKVAHLGMIQTAITRMASNSFLIKRWSVTLVAALFALAAANGNARFVYLAFFPTFMFWALDAYFLRQERLFRKLYDHARVLDAASVDYSMDTQSFETQVSCTMRVALSPTLGLFHGTITAVAIAVLLVICA